MVHKAIQLGSGAQRSIGPSSVSFRPHNGGGYGPSVVQGSSKTAGFSWFFIHYLTKSAENTTVPHEPNSQTDEDEEGGKIARLEAVLFLAREGSSSRKLAKLAGLADATEARTLIRRLNQTYDEQGRAFRVEEVAGGYALMTRAQFANWLRRLNHIPGERRLSQSAMETLAIVAYRQPVLRADVEAIRGVGCSEVLKQLMELDLIRISGRSEDLGRPYLYGTTPRFLQMYGLRSTDRLPRKEWVNEVQWSLSSSESSSDSAATSEQKESPVTQSFVATGLASNEQSEEELLDGTLATMTPEAGAKAALDDDEEDFFGDDGEDEEYEDDFGEDDDSEWDDDDEEDEDDDDDSDDLDDDNEWEEVSDDDDDDEDDDEEDGWDDDDDSDNGWEDDDDEDDDWD